MWLLYFTIRDREATASLQTLGRKYQGQSSYAYIGDLI
jgi:hypothetical protein